ncbi:hypothetical protein ACRAWF_18490 [Streptomyces sp. L7]
MTVPAAAADHPDRRHRRGSAKPVRTRRPMMIILSAAPAGNSSAYRRPPRRGRRRRGTIRSHNRTTPHPKKGRAGVRSPLLRPGARRS